MRGKIPSWIACLVTEKAAVIKACDAITVAAVASPTSGNWAQPGAILKNGLSIASGCASNIAPWPK